jgi:hypothetical protein
MQDDSIDMEDDIIDVEDDNRDMGYLVTLAVSHGATQPQHSAAYPPPHDYTFLPKPDTLTRYTNVRDSLRQRAPTAHWKGRAKEGGEKGKRGGGKSGKHRDPHSEWQGHSQPPVDQARTPNHWASHRGTCIVGIFLQGLPQKYTYCQYFRQLALEHQ